MKKLLFLFSIPSLCFAWSLFEMENEQRIYKNDHSHNQMALEISALEYAPTIDFQSTQRSLLKEKQINPGIAIGVNREMRLGAGFSWTLGGGGFYNKTWKEEIEKASPNLPEVVQNYNRETELYGAQALLNLNYQIEFTSITLQPFISFGLGKGQANTKVNYKYDLGPSSIQEKYNGTIEEDFEFVKYGLGANIIGSSGIFSYISVYENQFNTTKKQEKAEYQVNGGSIQNKNMTEKLNQNTKNLSLNLGVGYRF